MTLKVGINGLGRIGRCVARAIFETNANDIELIAVNGPAPVATHIQLLKYDSVHGRFPFDVSGTEEELVINGKHIKLTHERDPQHIAWADMGVDIVLECTGKFNKRDAAAQHLATGAKKILVSAPSDGADATIVYGVNNDSLQSDHQVISIGSCTTNGLAPVAKVLHDSIGIENGFMTTIHAYTGDQNLVDSSHKDLRRARAAGLSMIPTSTGAAKAIGLVIPELNGKINGVAVRVPTPNVSLIDLTFTASRNTTTDEINSLLTTASEGALKNILDVCSDPLVSIDYAHTMASSTVDLTGTYVTQDRLCRVASWYDNEWAFSCRMLDVARLLPG